MSQQLGTQKPAANSFCYPIGGQIFCDPAPTKPKPQAGNCPQGDGETTEASRPSRPSRPRKQIVGARVARFFSCAEG